MSSIIVGKVYANWCGYCQTLAPKWDAMKTMIPNSNITFVELEEPAIDENNGFVHENARIQVHGYPTIFKIHPNKKVEYYTSSQEPEDMKRWVLKNKKNKTAFRKKRNNKSRKNANKKLSKQPI